MNNTSVEIVASGLDNPRHLAFDADNALYVTEAGFGGNGSTIEAPELGLEFNYGLTGAITRIDLKENKQERILSELPSIATEDGSQAFGAQGIDFNENGELYYTIGFSFNLEEREENLSSTEQGLGVLYKFNFETDSSEKIADFVEYESLNNSDGGNDFVSNPYDILIQENDILVADAGSNVLLEVDENVEQNISLEAIFGPTNANGVPSQSVPIDVEIGTDGAYYVSEFTGTPYLEDGAAIYRIEQDSLRPEVYADGFSNISDTAFGNNGDLYVLEYDNNSLSLEGGTGELIRLSSDGTRTTLLNNLQDPTGLIVGSDDAIYVSNKGDTPGEGEILRIEDYSDTELMSMGSGNTELESNGGDFFSTVMDSSGNSFEDSLLIENKGDITINFF